MQEEDPTAVEPNERELPDKPPIDIPQQPVEPPPDDDEEQVLDEDFMDEQRADDDDSIDNKEQIDD